MLSWADQFNICCLLDNHQYQLPFRSYDCLLAVGAAEVFEPQDDLFNSLSQYYSITNDWTFGHFNYDVKNKIEDLTSHNFDGVGFPEVFLFVPQVLIQLNGHSVSIGSLNSDVDDVFNEITTTPFLKESSSSSSSNIDVKARTSKQKYIETVESLRGHIRRGDCYELNYCQEFYAEDVDVNPLVLYKKLTSISPNPFSAYYKVYDKYLICASPERYLKKAGDAIISQPIKGTSRRELHNSEVDNEQRQRLLESEKEKSENVMIVDLVRNDLSKVCKQGTVKVKELFGIYSFPQVHQMMSTIQGQLEDNIDLSAIIKATFPMGSMTGAPKKRVMELIEHYEDTKRGIYSGTVGYINPSKDFDFNVVIRSIMYNKSSAYLSYQVGSAITYNSNPLHEYEECLLKADAIKKVLQ